MSQVGIPAILTSNNSKKTRVMKKNIFTLLILGSCSVLLLTNSCKKSDPDPLYPQLIGSFQGITSQNDTIGMDVGNIKGILYVTMIKLNYTIPGGGKGSVYRMNSDGLTDIPSTFFSIVLDTNPQTSFIDGTFNVNNMTVAGTFKIYSISEPDNPSTGNYTAIKIK
jgi:hypothetical protein